MSPRLSFLKMGLELPLLITSNLQYCFHIFPNEHCAIGYLSLLTYFYGYLSSPCRKCKEGLLRVEWTADCNWIAPNHLTGNVSHNRNTLKLRLTLSRHFNIMEDKPWSCAHLGRHMHVMEPALTYQLQPHSSDLLPQWPIYPLCEDDSKACQI